MAESENKPFEMGGRGGGGGKNRKMGEMFQLKSRRGGGGK